MSVRWLSALVALLAGGCSSGQEAAAVDAGASDSAPVDAPDLDAPDALTCAVDETSACATTWSEPVLFDAKSGGARIVDVAFGYALLEPPRVIELSDRDPPVELVPADLPSSWHAVAIAEGDVKARAHALFCGPDACRVMRVDRDVLTPVGDDLPASSRALVVADGVPWVAGDGVRRLDGSSFRLELEGGRFRSIAASTWYDDAPIVVAAGEAGRAVVHADGAWSDLPVSTTATLVSASVAKLTVALLDEDGVVHFGSTSGVQPCTGAPLAASARLVPWSARPTLVGTTRDAQPFRWDGSRVACVGAADPGLQAVHPGCMWLGEWRVVDDVLYGRTSCPRD